MGIKVRLLLNICVDNYVPFFKHFKASDHSPEAQSAVKFGDTYSLTSIDRNVQADTGERRLLPTLFVVEKGQPVTYKALGPSSLYLIEGSHLYSMSMYFNLMDDSSTIRRISTGGP